MFWRDFLNITYNSKAREARVDQASLVYVLIILESKNVAYT